MIYGYDVFSPIAVISLADWRAQLGHARSTGWSGHVTNFASTSTVRHHGCHSLVVERPQPQPPSPTHSPYPHSTPPHAIRQSSGLRVRRDRDEYDQRSWRRTHWPTDCRRRSYRAGHLSRWVATSWPSSSLSIRSHLIRLPATTLIGAQIGLYAGCRLALHSSLQLL